MFVWESLLISFDFLIMPNQEVLRLNVNLKINVQTPRRLEHQTAYQPPLERSSYLKVHVQLFKSVI